MDTINTDKTRINLYLPRYLVDCLDDFSNEIGLSRSAAASMLLYQFYENKKNKELSMLYTDLLNKSGSKNVDEMLLELKSMIDEMKRVQPEEG